MCTSTGVAEEAIQEKKEKWLHCIRCSRFCREGENEWFWNRGLHESFMNYSFLPTEIVCQQCGCVPYPGGWSNVSKGWATVSTWGRNRQ